MNVLIKNYKKNKIDDLDTVKEGGVIKNKLDRIYDRSPNYSVFFIFAQKNGDESYSLEIKITSLNNKFHHLGTHHCVKEAFYEAITNIQNQIVNWNKKRFLTTYLNIEGL